MLVEQIPSLPDHLTRYNIEGAAPCYPERRTWIDTAMQTLSTTYGVPGTYTFGTVSLSAYPTYA